MPLGQMLIENGLITEEQLDSALEYQQKIGGRIGVILVKMRSIEEPVLIQFLAEHEHLPMVDLSTEVIQEEVASLLPLELIERLEALPIRKEAGRVIVAMSDPTDFDEVDEIRIHIGLTVDTVLAAPSQIRAAIQRIFYGDRYASAEMEDQHARKRKRYGMAELLHDLEKDAKVVAEVVPLISEERKILERADVRTMLAGLIDTLIAKNLLTEKELSEYVRTRLEKK